MALSSEALQTIQVGHGLSLTGKFPTRQDATPVVELPRTTLGYGQIAIAATGVAQKIDTAGHVAKDVILKALKSNGADVYVGSDGVSSSSGYPLAAGDAIAVSIDNTGKVFVSGTAGDKLAWLITG